MATFLTESGIEERSEPWDVFTVYGSFTEPTKGKNFIIIRIPSGRVPWAKKIAPAINRLIGPWMHAGLKGHDRFWGVDGEHVIRLGDKRLWDCTESTIRYEWSGHSLERVA